MFRYDGSFFLTATVCCINWDKGAKLWFGSRAFRKKCSQVPKTNKKNQKKPNKNIFVKVVVYV